MIQWAAPGFLLLLPLALLAPFFARRPRMAAAALSLGVTRLSLRRIAAPLPTVLMAGALACLVVALARPQEVFTTRVRSSEGIDILLVVDTSGSMEQKDYELGGRSVDRLEVTKEVIARFIEGRPDDRIGLVVFGEAAFTQVPLTLDHDALTRFLGDVTIGMAGPNRTAVGDALAVAGKRLKEVEAPERIAILLTDGASNTGMSPLTAAEALAALNIKVYTIGVGAVDGGGGGVFGGLFGRGGSDLDEGTLRSIARTTGGAYYRAGDAETLVQVYATINSLEKSTAEVEVHEDREERFMPWAWAALGLLLASTLLGETALRRLP